MLSQRWIVHKCPAEKQQLTTLLEMGMALASLSQDIRNIQTIAAKKKTHFESTGSRGQPEDNSRNAYTGTWTGEAQKHNKKINCLCFFLLAVGFDL